MHMYSIGKSRVKYEKNGNTYIAWNKKLDEASLQNKESFVC